MNNIQWDDYRFAYQVAQSGSLSKAARQLQCNHATVLRHINRLEQDLNVKLFIRHQRGYRLTDAGHIMVKEMPSVYAEFNRLHSLLESVEQDISGVLRITTLAEYSSLLNPALMQFRVAHPKLRIQLLSTEEIISLASGSAHVSIKIGPKPKAPDLIARKIMKIEMAYYAADSYVSQHGLPKNPHEFNQHLWVMPSAEKQHIPQVKQVMQFIDMEQLVYQSNNFFDLQRAIALGMGIGLMSVLDAESYPGLQRLEFKELANLKMDTLWFVYHRDLKNNEKVKTLYQYLLKNLS